MDKRQQVNIWYVLLAMLALLFFQSWWIEQSQVQTLPYSQFEKLLREGGIGRRRRRLQPRPRHRVFIRAGTAPEDLLGDDELLRRLKKTFPPTPNDARSVGRLPLRLLARVARHPSRGGGFASPWADAI